MHGGAPDPESSQPPARTTEQRPWAIALNCTAATPDITVTLLALAMVDDVVRVSGMVRVVGRAEVRLVTIPTLRLAPLNGPPLELLAAHVRPTGRHLWLSWLYERPVDMAGGYEGQIDHIEVSYQAGKVVQGMMPGPWVFRFRVPDPGDLDTRASTLASVEGA